MPLRALDHVNIRTADLTRAVAWYTDVLGLKRGPRPETPFDGAWMYLGGQAVVHLAKAESPPAAHDPCLEHFAVRADGLKEFLERLETRGTAYRLLHTPESGVVQVNIHDLDGVHIHVDFPDAEARALGLI